MSASARAAAFLFLGAAIGVTIGYGASGARSPAGATREGDPAAARAPAPELAASEQRVEKLEAELERERDGRTKAEEQRDAQAKEIAALRADLESAGRAAKAPDAARGAGTPEGAADAASARARRLDALAGELQQAVAAKDAKKLTAILKELGTLGKDAWPLVEKVMKGVGEIYKGAPAGGDKSEQMSLYRTLMSSDFQELFEDAIVSPDAHDASFRKMVAGYYIMSPGAKEKAPVQLGRENDPDVALTLLFAVNNPYFPTAKAEEAQPVVDALHAQKNPRIRAQITNNLASFPGDQAEQGLRSAASSDPDPAVRQAAQLALDSKQPQPVSGILVTYVAPDSDLAAAGVVAGDIVTAVNGQALSSLMDLAKVFVQFQKEAPMPETVSLKVYRSKQLVDLVVKLGVAGALSSNGLPVKAGP